MVNLIKDIDSILSNCNNEIDDKIIGVNYLEKLKYLLVDKIKLLPSNYWIECKNQEIITKRGDLIMLLNIENHIESTSKIKNNLKNDHLCIVVDGLKSLEIFENIQSNNSTSIKLFKNTGIVLPKKIIISESISKNTILINFKINIDPDSKKSEIPII